MPSFACMPQCSRVPVSQALFGVTPQGRCVGGGEDRVSVVAVSVVISYHPDEALGVEQHRLPLILTCVRDGVWVVCVGSVVVSVVVTHQLHPREALLQRPGRELVRLALLRA